MRVLLPIEVDEDRAIAAAEVVTSIPNADEEVHVTILNVEPEVDVKGAEAGNISSDDWYDAEEFPESVDKAAELLERAGIAVEKRREHADPSEAIIEVADEIEADRIIITARKRTPVGKVLFGSVTQSVILNAECPVTVVAE